MMKMVSSSTFLPCLIAEMDAVYINNHTAIWGSYYDLSTSQWGFACCHSVLPGSYCTGDAGKLANAASSASALLASSNERSKIEEAAEKERESLAEQHLKDLASGKAKKGKEREWDLPQYAKRREDGEELDLDKGRLKNALKEEKKRKKMGEDEAWQQTKKGKTDVTQEELGKSAL